MKDAYAHVMQVQICKDNTWSVTAVAPPIVMGDLTKDSQIKAFLYDVPPTICFGRLVFEHTEDLNFRLIGVKSPESLRTVKEVTILSRQSL
jgi:hypothetical protein